MAYHCPDGHESNNPDVCSVCGALIEPDNVPAAASAPAAGAAPAAAVTGSQGVCPNCGLPRAAGHKFCENCGADYTTGELAMPDARATAPEAASAANPAAAPGAVSPGAAGAPAPAPVTAAPAGAAISASTLEAIVKVDLSPRAERPDDEPPPADPAERCFLLDKDCLLIGRTNSSRMPNLALDEDHAVSRRHAELLRQADGSFVVRDIGSSNGTWLNGERLQGEEVRPVKPGDTLTLGFWTVIEFRDH
jgi:hypothetical protein